MLRPGGALADARDHAAARRAGAMGAQGLHAHAGAGGSAPGHAPRRHGHAVALLLGHHRSVHRAERSARRDASRRLRRGRPACRARHLPRIHRLQAEAAHERGGGWRGQPRRATCWWSAADLRAPPPRRCSRARVATSCWWKRRITRAFTSANPAAGQREAVRPARRAQRARAHRHAASGASSSSRPNMRTRASWSSATPGTRPMPYAWQVRRSVLDEILFRHAAASGAQALEGCKVHAGGVRRRAACRRRR